MSFSVESTMHKKQVEEAIDLYSTYSDVLNSKEKRELKKLKKKQCHFIVIGSTKNQSNSFTIKNIFEFLISCFWRLISCSL